VLVTREKATRRISLADADTTWRELFEEIDRLPPEDRFIIHLAEGAGAESRTDRVGAVISRGYSLGCAGSPGPARLVPRPSGVLYIVSPLERPDDVPGWIAHVPAATFRQHLFALHAPDETFAQLASQCAGESWHLDAFAQQDGLAEFAMELIGSRGIDLVHVVNARFGVDLVPALRSAYPATRVVVDVSGGSAQGQAWLRYVTSRYGNVIDAFCAEAPDAVAQLEAARVPPSRIRVLEVERGEAGVAAVHAEVWGRLIAALAD
jgi:hypothetical protein